MKYMYMICILLSSIFTYKSPNAKSTSIQYAFFIPQNAMQQNHTIQDIRLMRPRHIKTQISESTTKQNIISAKTSPEKDSQTSSSSYPASDKQPSNNMAATITTLDNNNSANKQTFHPHPNKAAAPKSSILTDHASLTSEKKQTPAADSAPNAISAEIAQKIQHYSLDNTPFLKNVPTFDTSPTQPTQPTLSYIEMLKKKNIKELLATIPYPDPNLPKFKQIYALYGMELRILQRRGKLPSNSEQKKILAKANSLQRFEVK